MGLYIYLMGSNTLWKSNVYPFTIKLIICCISFCAVLKTTLAYWIQLATDIFSILC